MTHRRIRPFIQANMDMNDIRARTIVNEMVKGKTNNVGEVTLRKGGTSTTISDQLITVLSMLDWSAKSPTAASYYMTLWYSSTEDGRVILNHVSTSASDAIFDYSVIG